MSKKLQVHSKLHHRISFIQYKNESIKVEEIFLFQIHPLNKYNSLFTHTAMGCEVLTFLITYP